jgi:hypothetical protein
MERIITEADLILFYHNECSESTRNYISKNLESHVAWMSFLDSYNGLFQDVKFPAVSPSPTTLRIIFEESQHQENPTY